MARLRRTLRQPWFVMPVVAALALGGWYLVRRDDGTSSASTPPTSQAVAATAGTMRQTITAQGTVTAAKTSDLSFTAAGTVTAVNVVAGQQVKAGDVLAVLDSAELQSSVSEAAANLASAEATLSDHQDADASDEQLTADASSVATARDRLVTAYEAAAGAQLVAGFDGTVASVDLTVGEVLGSGGSSATSPTGSSSGSGLSASTLGSGLGGNGSTASTSNTGQIVLVTTSSYTVDVGLDATDVKEVKAGQSAALTVTTATSSNAGPFGGFGGFPGFAGFNGNQANRQAATNGSNSAGANGAGATGGQQNQSSTAATATGAVQTVGAVADASSGVASFPVTVAFDDTSGEIHAGSTVNVEITVAELSDVVQVPSFAVHTTDGQPSVTVRTESGDEERAVTTGLTSGGMVQIVSGLQAGEQVVLTRGAGLGGGPAGGVAPTGSAPAGGVPSGANGGAGG